MILHYKPIEESNKEDGIGFSSSDPTPALPEREGAGNHAKVLNSPDLVAQKIKIHLNNRQV